GAREIRLIALAPGERFSPVVCTSYPAYIHQHPEFEALSYTWGPKHSLKCIEFKSSLIYVTKNLEAALRRLRSTNATRHIWVDALCINQDDNTERSSQVSLMREIYSQASRVIVWLGEGSHSTNSALEFL
ncbi:hypothetical protein BDZ45DRAFT_540435, partial [Acephala macrosclerotiorum]